MFKLKNDHSVVPFDELKVGAVFSFVDIMQLEVETEKTWEKVDKIHFKRVLTPYEEGINYNIPKDDQGKLSRVRIFKQSCFEW